MIDTFCAFRYEERFKNGEEAETVEEEDAHADVKAVVEAGEFFFSSLGSGLPQYNVVDDGIGGQQQNEGNGGGNNNDEDANDDDDDNDGNDDNDDNDDNDRNNNNDDNDGNNNNDDDNEDNEEEEEEEEEEQQQQQQENHDPNGYKQMTKTKLGTSFNNKARGINSELNVQLRKHGLTVGGTKPEKITRLFNHYKNNGNNETTTVLPANNTLSREDQRLINDEKLRLEENHEQTKAAGRELTVGSAEHRQAAIVTKAAGAKKRRFISNALSQQNWLIYYKRYLEGVDTSTTVLMNIVTHLRSFEQLTEKRWQPSTAATVAKTQETAEANFEDLNEDQLLTVLQENSTAVNGQNSQTLSIQPNANGNTHRETLQRHVIGGCYAAIMKRENCDFNTAFDMYKDDVEGAVKTQHIYYLFHAFTVKHNIHYFIYHCGGWTKNVRPFLENGALDKAATDFDDDLLNFLSRV